MVTLFYVCSSSFANFKLRIPTADIKLWRELRIINNIQRMHYHQKSYVWFRKHTSLILDVKFEGIVTHAS